MMNDLSIRHKGYLFGVSGDYLRVSKDGIALVEVRVAPMIEGKTTRLSDWSQVEPNHLAAQVEDIEATVHMEADHGHACCHVKTPVHRFERLAILLSCDYEDHEDRAYKGSPTVSKFFCGRGLLPSTR